MLTKAAKLLFFGMGIGLSRAAVPLRAEENCPLCPQLGQNFNISFKCNSGQIGALPLFLIDSDTTHNNYNFSNDYVRQYCSGKNNNCACGTWEFGDCNCNLNIEWISSPGQSPQYIGAMTLDMCSYQLSKIAITSYNQYFSVAVNNTNLAFNCVWQSAKKAVNDVVDAVQNIPLPSFRR